MIGQTNEAFIQDVFDITRFMGSFQNLFMEVQRRRLVQLEEIKNNILSVDIIELRKLYNYYQIGAQIQNQERTTVTKWIDYLCKEQILPVGRRTR